jgi:hypothetical protein
MGSYSLGPYELDQIIKGVIGWVAYVTMKIFINKLLKVVTFVRDR